MINIFNKSVLDVCCGFFLKTEIARVYYGLCIKNYEGFSSWKISFNGNDKNILLYILAQMHRNTFLGWRKITLGFQFSAKTSRKVRYSYYMFEVTLVSTLWFDLRSTVSTLVTCFIHNCLKIFSDDQYFPNLSFCIHCFLSHPWLICPSQYLHFYSSHLSHQIVMYILIIRFSLILTFQRNLLPATKAFISIAFPN